MSRPKSGSRARLPPVTASEVPLFESSRTRTYPPDRVVTLALPTARRFEPRLKMGNPPEGLRTTRVSVLELVATERFARRVGERLAQSTVHGNVGAHSSHDAVWFTRNRKYARGARCTAVRAHARRRAITASRRRGRPLARFARVLHAWCFVLGPFLFAGQLHRAKQ